MWILFLCIVVSGIWIWWSEMKRIVSEVESQKKSFDEILNNFYHNSFGTYSETLKQIEDLAISIEKNNNKLKKLKFYKNQDTILGEVRNAVSSFKSQLQNVEILSTSQMLDASNYGQVNKGYWNMIHCMNRNEVETILYKFIRAFDDKASYEKCILLKPDQLLQCIWFFAFERPFSVEDFDKSCKLFNFFYKMNKHIDLYIAKFYAMKQIGGEESFRKEIEFVLKNSNLELPLIASGFMWMKAYQSEQIVLQHMLSTGMNMTEKTQKRLHSLTQGGGKSHEIYDVFPVEERFYFDVSALTWKDDEYIGLFEQLAFQDKALCYALAVRDENKELFVPQNINIPDNAIILNEFKSTFAKEYGSIVKSKIVDCSALSGSGEEKMNGILVFSNECKQMGVLIFIVKIGKKLSIKFYTLFMPTGSDLKTQKQEALSLHNKLSHAVSMWESSLKDTMLMAVEHLLNDYHNSPFVNPINDDSDTPFF